ncbi:MAG: precorrin-4 C(11)-methyltransferase [Candidatus Hydrothermarchaeales archaeon]
MTVFFIGAGPGDPELLTIKAKKVIEKADVVIYAGSLVNPEILGYAKAEVKLYNSAKMNLEEILDVIIKASEDGKTVARIHSGDPSIYGAIAEQIRLLDERGILYEIIPGVSSFLSAAASLKKEYTIPEVVQTVIITRAEGRTKVPEKEKLQELAKHRASMCIFLSVGMIKEVTEELTDAYGPKMPVAVVYRASWSDEKVIQGTLEDIAEKVKGEDFKRTALILVGDFLKKRDKRSKLYDKDFSHGFRGKK